MSYLRELIATHARPGRVGWIGVRGVRRAQMQPLERVGVSEAGLAGDHAPPGKRAVTLIQAEHLPVIAALCEGEVTAGALRRNIHVSGINLAALRGQDVAVGTATLRITGPCAPCSRMEETLGRGGYSAVRHHGGWCASVLSEGEIALGDTVTLTGGAA
ncbi:MOSC domain-containing protein [Jannaschia faecimaris]|uniref:MOSC domain-containing protein n=1 Tax=Jannaschia faecimaris TaxID=1244108 RepID=A0A1H3PZM3_9RHOB|nr:MOSC domain-containing protein [Jannaschia faecimaris]SDZ05889.1 MOSC domain-containing protein [Jannaschia faecimaris]